MAVAFDLKVSVNQMKEVQPFGIYFPLKADSMIIGSFPIGKFTNTKRTNEIKPHEHRFYFGRETNLLWKLLATTFNKKITAMDDIKAMLESKKIGLGGSG